MRVAVCRAILTVGLHSALLMWGAVSPSMGHAQGAPPSYSDMTWLTVHYPPTNWQDPKDGSAKGIFVDILRKIVGKEWNAKSISFHPWPRSYHLVSTEPMTSLFAIGDIPERRKIMKFSDPVAMSDFGIICRKSVIDDLKAAGKISKSFTIGKDLRDSSPLAHLTIGVIQDDVTDQMIRKQKLAPKAISYASSFERLAHRLLHGRIDALAFNHRSTMTKFKAIAKKKPAFKLEHYEMIYLLAKMPIAFAFHKDVPKALLDRFNGDLARLKATGAIEAIFRKYRKIGPPNTPKN